MNYDSFLDFYKEWGDPGYANMPIDVRETDDGLYLHIAQRRRERFEEIYIKNYIKSDVEKYLLSAIEMYKVLTINQIHNDEAIADAEVK